MANAGPVPASGATTNYSNTFDGTGALTQTLGPEHMALVDGQETLVRTASWTYTNVAGEETVSAQGYETVGSGNFTLVNPVSIELDNTAGQTTDQISATLGSSLTWASTNSAAPEVLLGSTTSIDALLQGLSANLPTHSCYTAWTAYQYNATDQLTATAIYTVLPSDSNALLRASSDGVSFYDPPARASTRPSTATTTSVPKL